MKKDIFTDCLARSMRQPTGEAMGIKSLVFGRSNAPSPSPYVRRILNNKRVFVQAEPEPVEGVAVYTASAFDKLRRRLCS